jgi:hypothetical protein
MGTIKSIAQMKIFAPIVIALLLVFGYYAASLYSSRHCSNNIDSINSFSEAQKTLDAADQDTLVLFDVDETLITTPTKSYWQKNRKAHQKEIKELEDDASKRAAEDGREKYIFSKRLATEIPVVIEASTPALIASLQERGVKVLALSRYSTGTNGFIRNLPQWRSDKLKKIGIDFGKTIFPDIIFDELPGDTKGFYPVLYQGILLTNRVPKGEVLGAFLDRMQYKPARVLFFDDQKDQVALVAAEMCKRDIPFEGYVYNGASQLTAPFNKRILALQFSYLLDHEEWLSDEEAQELLESTNETEPLSSLIQIK